MILAYNHLQPTFTVAGGALQTDAAALGDRRPASVARFTWPTGTQTTSVTCTIQCGFGESRVRVVALLNTTLPPGLRVKLYGKRASDADYTYALGGTSDSQTLATRVDGGTGAVWVLPADNDPLVGLAIVAYNDVDTGTRIAAGASIDVGEVVISDAVEFVIQNDWTIGGKDPSKTTRTLGSQPSRTRRPGYRTLDCTPAFDDADAARHGGLDNGADWQTVAAALRADPTALAIARTNTVAEIQTTSLYGLVTRIPEVKRLPGPNYQPGQLSIEEVPG